MLCEKCHSRQATVHLTSDVSLTSGAAGEVFGGHRDFCEICFPFGSLPEEQQTAAIRELLGLPPDVPIISAEAGESPDSR